MAKEIATRQFWAVQVRVQEEGYGNTDSTRDWLHEDAELVFPYETKEDALAMLDEALDEECAWRNEQDAELSVDWKWERKVFPGNDYGGNGFWFELRNGDEVLEGRALVRAVQVPVAR